MKYIEIPNSIPVVAAVIFMMAAAPSAPLHAGEVSVTYRFDYPAVTDAGRGFSRISFPATIQSGRPGEPAYPYRGIAILMPPGEAVSAVRIDRRGWRQLGGSYRLHPMQLPVPIQKSKHRNHAFLHKEEAYLIDRWVQPPDPELRTHHCRGHAIAVGALSPAAYHPLSGSVGFYREVEITVETAVSAASSKPLELLRTDTATHGRIAAIVDNPCDLAWYGGAAAVSTTAEDYEYLIVTRDSLRDAFKPLRDFHTRRGLRARIMSVEEIESSFAGLDTEDRIRNAIIHEYTSHGITHVLLGGDADGEPGVPKVVPYRGFYCYVQGYWYVDDENIPADVYFAALDGNWNADGDSLWGEEGEEDLYPEIAVGRACVETQGEVATFIDKTLLYQEDPVSDQVRSALLLGEILWYEPKTYGGDELEELVGTCTEHDFITTGIPADFDTATLFDRDIFHWDKTEARDAINAGTHWVAHSGHCNMDYALRFYLPDITDADFTNDGVSTNLIIITTSGCYAGAFDNNDGDTYYMNLDCAAEKMLKIQHCAVAFLGNSRFGWTDTGSTKGTSHHYLREFYDAIFTEGYHTIGAANLRSKEESVPYIELSGPGRSEEYRWCYFTIHVLGDPALDPWTDTPDSLNVTHPASIGRYDQSVELFTLFIPGASATLFHDGVCYGRGVGTPVGYIVLHRLLTFPDSIDAIELNVTAHNHYTYRDTIAIEGLGGDDGPPPVTALYQNTPNPFNPSTAISFSLDREGPVDLRVYDVAGREVDRLIDRFMEAGVHTVTWRPVHLPSGLYLYVLRAGGISTSKKAVLLR